MKLRNYPPIISRRNEIAQLSFKFQSQTGSLCGYPRDPREYLAKRIKE
jgi:hypothetical protein